MMFKKNSKIIITLFITILLCFYTSYKLSYKKFSSENYKSPTNSKIILSDTKSKNNIKRKNNSNYKREKSSKEITTLKVVDKNYTYEDYFNKLKEIGLYKNRFNLRFYVSTL